MLQEWNASLKAGKTRGFAEGRLHHKNANTWRHVTPATHLALGAGLPLWAEEAVRWHTV
jgi:hypothetical protein